MHMHAWARTHACTQTHAWALTHAYTKAYAHMHIPLDWAPPACMLLFLSSEEKLAMGEQPALFPFASLSSLTSAAKLICELLATGPASHNGSPRSLSWQIIVTADCFADSALWLFGAFLESSLIRENGIVCCPISLLSDIITSVAESGDIGFVPAKLVWGWQPVWHNLLPEQWSPPRSEEVCCWAKGRTSHVLMPPSGAPIQAFVHANVTPHRGHCLMECSLYSLGSHTLQGPLVLALLSSVGILFWEMQTWSTVSSYLGEP